MKYVNSPIALCLALSIACIALSLSGCNSEEVTITTSNPGGDSTSAQPSTTVQTVSLSSVPDVSINEGQVMQISLTASGSGQPSFACVQCPAFVSINNSTGQVSIAPNYGDAGSYPVQVKAVLGSLEDDASFVINVAHTNRAPAFSAAAENQSGAENSALSFTILASDPDSDPVSMSVSNLPAGASASASNGSITISWTPGYSAAGSYTVNLSASDGSLSASKAISITISNTNRAPYFGALGTQNGSQNNAMSFLVTSFDPDGDSMSISATSLPSGASFNGSTFSWTPSCSQEGSFSAVFRSTDSGGAYADVTVPISIAHTNCYNPAWQDQGTVNTYIKAAASGNNVDITAREVTALDPQTGVTISYAGIWFDCFNQSATSSVLYNDVFPKYNNPVLPASVDRGVTVRLNIPGAMLTDKFWVLFKSTDADGASIYVWFRFQRMNDGTVPAAQTTSILQGSTYDTAGFCAGAGYTHTN